MGNGLSGSWDWGVGGPWSVEESDDLSWLALTVSKNVSGFNSSGEPGDITLRFLNHIKQVSIYLWIMGVHRLQSVVTSMNKIISTVLLLKVIDDFIIPFFPLLILLH